MTPTITIPRDAFPSGQYDVTLKAPTFKDRILARKKHPGEDSRCGYTVQDLLCAMCLHSVNGQEVPQGPFDMIDRLKQIPLSDSQFLLTVFLSTFTVDEELATKAKELSDRFRAKGTQQCVIPATDMPTGTFSVTFTEPVMEDSMRLERVYPGEKSNCGYSFEELVFADSIIAINGEPVKRSSDPIQLILDWSHLDAQFACAVFLKVAYIDQQRGSEGERLGKSLRTGLYKPDVTKGSAVTAQTSSARSSSKPATTKDTSPTLE